MAIVQNNIADAFVCITDMNQHLGMSIQDKLQLQKLACLYFVKYLNCKIKYPEKIQSIQDELSIPENYILDALSTCVISEKEIKNIKTWVVEIQKLFINNLPPETEEFQFLKTMFPDLLNHKESTSSN